ncbi:MAG TPA: hypothetical protein VMW49_08115 [Candidatus Dormibacteraeota bacterium]|nr:hypothetical protein [Candidatus Dormibacteraeota bacterium]
MSPRRALSAFGRFWWEFVVGDTPEIAAGTGLIVAAAWLLARHDNLAAVIAVPAAVVALLVGSVRRGRTVP